MKDNYVTDLIKSSGIKRVESELIALSLESIRLRTEIENDESIAISYSKLGGKPDLPKSISWPQYNGRSLHFIAQINLEHINIGVHGLPEVGLLSIFYDALEQPWGFDPEDRGRWQVLYFEKIDNLERKMLPDDIVEQGTFLTSKISFIRQTTIPSIETLSVNRLELSDEEQDLYCELFDNVQEHNNSTDISHRLLGHPEPVQGEMQLQCQLVTNGLYCGNSTGYNDPRRILLEPKADSWKLLLQIDSEEQIGMMWGDVGRIYFWILEEELEKQNFDNVWVVLQCG